VRGDVFKPYPHWSGANASEADDIAVAIVRQIAAAVMAVAGPLFWAVLTLGLVADLLR
jgi:hypothetical protein